MIAGIARCIAVSVSLLVATGALSQTTILVRKVHEPGVEFTKKCRYWAVSNSNLELDHGPSYPSNEPFRMLVHEATSLRIFQAPDNQLIVYSDNPFRIRQLNSSGDNYAAVEIYEDCKKKW